MNLLHTNTVAVNYPYLLHWKRLKQCHWKYLSSGSFFFVFQPTSESHTTTSRASNMVLGALLCATSHTQIVTQLPVWLFTIPPLVGYPLLTLAWNHRFSTRNLTGHYFNNTIHPPCCSVFRWSLQHYITFLLACNFNTPTRCRSLCLYKDSDHTEFFKRNLASCRVFNTVLVQKAVSGRYKWLRACVIVQLQCRH